MSASKHIMIGLVLFTAGTLAVPAHGSQQAGDKKPSNTWQMRCVVKVTADTDVLPLNFELVESLLRSDGVAGEAARATWPKGHGSTDAYIEIRPLECPDFTQPEVVGPFPAETRTVLFGLRIHLDNEVGPVAREFSNALIENLRAELQKAFAARSEELKKQLTEAESRQQAIRTEFKDMLRQNTFASPEPILRDSVDQACHEKLEQAIDLSMLTQQTPASEAFEILKYSVVPPLNLIVIWRDLFDNANIEPTSPVQMDGPANVLLGTALRNVLDALTAPLAAGREYHVDYVVSGGAITVATRIGLPAKKVETRVYDLPPLLRMGNQAPELVALIRETIEPPSWHNPYLGSGNGTITASPDGRLIVSQSRDIHIRIQELLAKVTADFGLALPAEVSQEAIAERLGFLLPYREQLEQELDRLQERQSQIAREQIDIEKRALKETLRTIANHLYAAGDELRQIHADMAKTKPDAPLHARLQQAIQKVEQCMNRCRVASPGYYSHLGGEIVWPHENKEANTVAERIAAKQRDLREVSRRIAETHRMMAGSKVFDTELRQIEWTARRYEQADAQVHDMKTRLASLQPCAVTVIGGIE